MELLSIPTELKKTPDTCYFSGFTFSIIPSLLEQKAA